MSVSVYIWLPRLGPAPISGLLGLKVGHSALNIGSHYGSHYVSFAPEGGMRKWEVKESKRPKLKKNLREEFPQPDKTIKLYNLNEVAMANHWEIIKRDEWNLYRNNCSTVVAKLLIIGAKSKLDEGIFTKYRPKNVYRPDHWITFLNGSFAENLAQTTTWGPWSVLHLANKLRVIQDQ